MAVQFEFKEGKIKVTDLISIQALDKGFFGTFPKEKKIEMDLMPEEALYLLDVRNGVCIDENNNNVSFNTIGEKLQGKKFMARYFCFKDWRDKGLVARDSKEADMNYGRSPTIKYPSKEFHELKVKSKAVLYHDDLMAVIDEDEEAKQLYEENWFGQYGTYKAQKHGKFLKLDAYETLFLSDHCKMKLNIPKVQLKKEAKRRRDDFNSLYEVYEDLRLRGFVLKTGFKFGTHFRLYFPGAKPTLGQEEWMHSRHVIHIFPRETKLIISEWARAIRVAHGVKKTFILAIPGQKKERRENESLLDFLLYYRKKGGIAENPKIDKPKYVMLALSEEEEIGGEELSQAIEEANKLGLGLLLAICDRETAVTYYRVKKIELAKSKFEYYEIEWAQP